MMGAARQPGHGDEDRRAALSLISVSRETEDRLAAYADCLRRWQRIKNLVGPSTLDTLWTRHIADSAQLLSLAPDALHWVDLGSGAGFPGLVIAILLRGRANGVVDLVESNERKCAFLRDAVRVTDAPARVHADRIDAVLPRLSRPVDVVTSRALAPLPDLLAMSQTLLDEGALGLFLVGDDLRSLSGLPESGLPGLGSYDIRTVPSVTHPASRVVLVHKRHVAEAVGPRQ